LPPFSEILKLESTDSSEAFITNLSIGPNVGRLIVMLIFVWVILVDKQLDAHFLLCYVYVIPLHVSSNYVLILRRTSLLTF